LGFQNEPINWVFIRSVRASVAAIAITPLQDVLGLGTEARNEFAAHGKWKLEMALRREGFDEGR
jgi:hypothetical protein